jgi:hypothetical protein
MSDPSILVPVLERILERLDTLCRPVLRAEAAAKAAATKRARTTAERIANAPTKAGRYLDAIRSAGRYGSHGSALLHRFKHEEPEHNAILAHLVQSGSVVATQGKRGAWIYTAVQGPIQPSPPASPDLPA